MHKSIATASPARPEPLSDTLRHLAWQGLGWLIAALTLAGGFSLLSLVEGDVSQASADASVQRLA
ncbi:hypothetical protein RQP53_10020 [Paucibacter sp. APW11]|uniref:Uncharacterized protein n=1 Tax=Roseateles aquae TaxID=3077235 RepID=A0ABU3PAI3_9BURK|nr:hypothetical protein [Paucibacter sp. APW11]MDT8999601.1 hypothetical protein [Paucibacter sp. APW11]